MTEVTRGWPRFKIVLAMAAFLLATPASAVPSLSASGCGSLENHFGPLDYRVDKKSLPRVERAHFTPNIENLSSGNTGALGGELDYTLRAFPNHPRALMAMLRLGLRDHTDRPVGARYTVECWMIRAEAFRDDDPMVKMIYGVYLLKKGRAQEAVEKLEAADALSQNNANLYYNLGLAYMRLGRYQDALRNAHKAYALGFPLHGLRAQLERAGQWRMPTPAEQGVDKDAPSAHSDEDAPTPAVAD